MAFEIIRNDITRVRADAIVNTANPEPCCGGGTDYAIYHAAGERQLLAARQKIGRISRGQAAATPAFRLHAEYIIHTVGPVWKGGNDGEFEILRSCYENSLQLAMQLECSSIAFPLIATGVYGFPKDKALQIAVSVIEPFLMEHEMKIILVVFDKKAFELSGSVVDNIREFVDSQYVEQARKSEYRIDSEDRPSHRSSRFRNRILRGSGNTEELSFSDVENRCEQSWYPEADEVDDVGLLCDDVSAEYDLACDLELSPEQTVTTFGGGISAHKRKESGVEKMPLGGAAKICPQSDSGRMQASTASVSAQMSMLPPEPSASLPYSYAKKVDIDRLLANSEKTFQEKLFEIIDARGLTGPQVYKNYVSKQVYSKIQADRYYHPNKYTAIALCLSLHLNLAETQDLIGRAGWTLSRSKKSDLIVIACIMNHEYNLVQINLILFDYDCPELEKIK